MSTSTRAAKASAIRRLMKTEGAAVAKGTRGFNAGRQEVVAALDEYEALKDRARRIKEEAIERLPELIERLRERIEARGGTVYVVEDAADARGYIAEVTKGARRLVKSKSMTSEEIEINEHLEAHGVEVVETDLGEWVLQLADESPSHLVAPAIHKSRAAIAELFNRHFAPDEPLETAEELTRFARERLGALIQGADVGMTGANFIAADSGTIALVTSEGNARKSALVPPTYIAVAGVEKIVPTVEDLQPFIELIGRSATGQHLTSYVSLLTPPFASPVPDFTCLDTPMEAADRAFHLVLIDNGRLAMREDSQLRETLYCIRCGACANVCANFQEVGGHAFGGQTYTGGIATGWEAGVHGLESTEAFNDLCTGCTRCVPACPVKIDIPWINVVVRDRLNRGRSREGEGIYDWLASGLVPKGQEEPRGLDLAKRAFGHFHRLARLGSRTAPLSNWIARLKPMRYAMERVLGIDRRRALPAFKRETLRTWFEQRERSERAHNASREVVLFCDAYTNYVHTERGKAAIRVLEAVGVSVRLSAVEESGRAPLSQGMITTATERAHAVARELGQHIEAGRDVVVIEPSDLAMFKRDYRKLLPEEDGETLQARSFEIVDYIGRCLEGGADSGVLGKGRGQKIAYHSHCQQRTLGLEAPTVALLRRLGYDVETSQVECCGMAGSFGYKTEYYELSMAVGKHLGEQLSAAEMQGRTLVASGTSCQEQLEGLLRRPVRHPVELIAPPQAPS